MGVQTDVVMCEESVVASRKTFGGAQAATTLSPHLDSSEEGRLARTTPTLAALGTDIGVIELNLTRKHVEGTPIRP